MFKKFAAIGAVLVSSLGISSARASDSPNTAKALVVKPGDIIVHKDESGWSAVKILAVDPWPDGSSAAHCLTYKAVPAKPTIESLRQATVLIWHAPIDAGSFSEGWQWVGNQAPAEEEFVGFVEYLKLTDFPRYIAFTGQDSKEIVRKANEHYKRGYALGDQGKRTEAISEYSQAIDIFPLFYEAIDNRAFTYMELGKMREALHDFEQSLQVNPDGVSAFFSKGECLMKLGELSGAEAIFRDGQTRFPEKRANFTKFLEQVHFLQKKG